MGGAGLGYTGLGVSPYTSSAAVGGCRGRHSSGALMGSPYGLGLGGGAYGPLGMQGALLGHPLNP